MFLSSKCEINTNSHICCVASHGRVCLVQVHFFSVCENWRRNNEIGGIRKISTTALNLTNKTGEIAYHYRDCSFRGKPIWYYLDFIDEMLSKFIKVLNMNCASD